MELEAKILVECLRNIQEQLVDVEETIEDLCLCFDDYKFLLTIPGFGPYISAVVLAAIGNPCRFQNANLRLQISFCIIPRLQSVIQGLLWTSRFCEEKEVVLLHFAFYILHSERLCGCWPCF